MSDAAKWEADHQRAALERYGLAEEFPWGCDAIDHVAEALMASRKQLAAARKVIEAASDRWIQRREARGVDS